MRRLGFEGERIADRRADPLPVAQEEIEDVEPDAGRAPELRLADGLVVSELGAAIPGSGGAYVFLRDSFGKRWGRLMAFLFIWQFFFVGPLGIASGNMGLLQYLGYCWPAAALTDSSL